MIDIAETFGNRLKSIRCELGLSQEQIARHLHCNRSAYSYYELGRTEPSLEKLIRLADIFGLSVDVLLGHEITGAAGETANPGKKQSGNAVLLNLGDLTKEEQNLILGFRMLPQEQRKELPEHIAVRE